MSRRTWPFGLLIAVACTAPPRPAPEPTAQVAAPVRLKIALDAPALDAAALEAAALPPLESALAGVPAVTGLAARIDDGHADVIATLSTPAAIDAVRAALQQESPRIPPAVGAPQLTRISDLVLTLTLPFDGSDGAVRAAIERSPGVARVDTCGGHEPVLTIELDRSALASVALDRVLEAVDHTLRSDGPGGLPGRLADAPIAGTRHVLGHLASIREDRRLRPCAARTARGPVLLLSVFARPDADPQQVAADARAHAVELVSPSPVFFADPLPTDSAPLLTALALELAATGLAATDLADCLAARPSLPPWALVFPDPSAPERVRLLLATLDTTPLQHVLKDMSECTTVRRIGVLAPRADADHPLSVRVRGDDPVALAAVADLAAARLASVPGVTDLRVLAPRPGPASLRLDREALAARQLDPIGAARALRLAHAPLTLTGAGGRLVELDLPDRTAPDDPAPASSPLLKDLGLGSAAGLVPLSELVQPALPGHAPRYRFDRSPAAAVDLRLRRASDREAVQRALEGLILPVGVALELGPELPFPDP